MTETRCEPPEELRGVDGWHWVEAPVGEPLIARWHPAERSDLEPLWTSAYHVYSGTPRYAAREWGWRYDSPVLTPAEVAALRAERDAAVALLDLPEHNMAQRIYHLQESMKFLANIARSFGFANRKQETNPELIGRALREQAAEVAALRAEAARLHGALGKIANLYEVVWDRPPPEGDGHPMIARPRTQPTEGARIARAALEPQP